ncbi:MAG: CC/Se motif family (seleno)protein [Peptoniphilaceae bacterium]|nr:CC/Se motif family (seleno)protein [Peptoniphilaceae bacterium]MDY6019431.1 CC/Se motif family (seleno)protein [Anaerococcus sp.]
MKVSFSNKAKEFIKEKNIDNLVVDLDLNSKANCCGMGSVDFKVTENAKDKVKNYKKADSDLIDVYFSPSLNFYFDDNSILDIGCVGLLKFKKLYVANEINILAN